MPALLLLSLLINAAASIHLHLNSQMLSHPFGFALEHLHLNDVCEVPYNAPLYKFFDKALEGTGYGYEPHEAITDDGYILTLVRLIKSDEDDKARIQRPPVLF